jgi:uncharacterized protein
MSNQNKDVKSLLLAAIIATGVFAGAFGSIQLLNANAQSVNPDKPMPVDIGCETGAEICENVTESTVSTSGSATTKVQPDKFTVTVGVETNGITAAEAASANAELIAKVIAALKQLGISEKDISTSSYTVFPVYSVVKDMNSCRVMEGYPIPPECFSDQVITGYKASNSISITLDTNASIDAGKVIDTAINARANTVQGAYFFISTERQEEIRTGLIDDAIENARHRAEAAANAVDMHISGVKSINLNDVFFPIFAKDPALAVDTPILPGQQEVTMTVNIVYLMSNGIGGGGSQDIDSLTIARDFIKSKLSGLGIQINSEFDLHTDMVVHVSDTEIHLDYAVVDKDGGVHDGHIEVVSGKVTVATLDDKSIL